MAVGLALTATLVVLHITFVRHVGGLWRDEVQIVNLGNMPTLAEMWDKNEHDSFPIAWHLLIRLWTKLGLGQTDFSLRCLGLLMGLGIVAVLWWVVRQFHGSAPLVSLTLCALSPTVIWFGDSMRGYGLGTLTMLFLFGAFWRMVESPTRGCAGLALFAAVLAVQSMYFNAVLLFAMGAGGAAVAIWRRDWKLLALIAAIGITAALSLLPYLDPLSRQGRWSAVVKVPVEMGHLYAIFSQAITLYGSFMYWIWMGFPLLVVFACVWYCKRTWSVRGAPRKELIVYLPLLMLVGGSGYLYLLVKSQLPTQVWYYIDIMAFLAVVFDLGVDLLIAGHWIGRCVRMAVVAILVAIIVLTIWPLMHVRLTNVDLLAQKLESVAGPDDLIVVVRWWPGVTFNRYYHGRAPWTSVPELSDMSIQRFDLLKEKMAENEPIRPLWEKMAKTLSAGHRIWFVGGLVPMRSDENPGQIPPLPENPPDPQDRWRQEPYLTTWTRQVTWIMLNHTNLNRVEVPCPEPVLPFENVPLVVADGWR